MLIDGEELIFRISLLSGQISLKFHFKGTVYLKKLENQSATLNLTLEVDICQYYILIQLDLRVNATSSFIKNNSLGNSREVIILTTALVYVYYSGVKIRQMGTHVLTTEQLGNSTNDTFN